MQRVMELSDYHIQVGDCSESLDLFLQKRSFSKIWIICDSNTHRDCLPVLLRKVPSLEEAAVIVLPPGEIHKNLGTCQVIWKQMLDGQTDRKALVINLGGGVIGDMGGFAAASYKRGIAFIQIPTSLLAQVDASIGGKLGVDFENVKNIIGCFQNPQAVFIDPDYLDTLPDRQLRNGYAEVLKHALIADASYWDMLRGIDDPVNVENWTEIIYRSLEIKRAIVEEDPFEKGLRKVLNFGHTIGHAIESYSLSNDADPLLHGEAIVHGMLAELFLSQKKLDFYSTDLETLRDYFYNIYPTYSLKEESIPFIIDYMKNDKKNEGTRMNFTLLESIGKSVYDQAVNREEVMESLSIF